MRAPVPALETYIIYIIYSFLGFARLSGEAGIRGFWDNYF